MTVDYVNARFVTMAERVEYVAGVFTWMYQYGGKVRGEVVAWQKAPAPYHKHK